MNGNYRLEATLTDRFLLQPVLQVWKLNDCMFFSHQGRKSHLFLISNNDTTQYAQSEIKQSKKIGFLQPKGTDAICEASLRMDSNAGIITEYSGIYGVDISIASAGATMETQLAPFLLKVWLLASCSSGCIRFFMLLIKRKE